MFDPKAISTRFLFFSGKGGVGKTTLACASAIQLADRGERVLLVSTDPASNLDEVLGVALGSRPRPVCPRLDALNVDPQAAAEEYRRRALGPYEGVVSEAELATMREELAGACTVEIAAFDRFATLLAGDEDAASYDRVVFDTAPTGHTLRLLDLPRAWTTFLDASTRGASCLGPHGGLVTRRDRFREARAALEDPARTTVVLVSRADVTSLREAERAARELVAVGVTEPRLVINGRFVATDRDDTVAAALEARERAALQLIPPGLAALPRDEVPLRPFEMVGLAALRAVLDASVEHPDTPVASDEPADDIEALSRLVDELEGSRRGLVLVTGKGGVGKTTIASALAIELASRGVEVHLGTTDPAAHVAETVGEGTKHLQVSRIDPRAEVARYVEHVLARKGGDLDAGARAALEEDLRSPCTEEVAVFHAFSRVVAQARGPLVILDTAPTGHTLLLLDATGSYHREVLRGVSPVIAAKTITPLMRLRDASFTRVVLVTTPETTPVSEAAALQEDLRRAGIEPWAWVVNCSLEAARARDPLLRARATIERRQVARVRGLARRFVVVPWTAESPRGAAALRGLARSGRG